MATDNYWLGQFAMAAALASKRPDPQPLLRSTVQDFLKDRPPGDALRTIVASALGEKQT
jgi:hypothetical protein